MKRVAVTGMAGVTALGADSAGVLQALRSGRSGIGYMREWDEYRGLRTRLAGRIDDLQTPAHYPRKSTRTMGRVALLAALATERALQAAGLAGDPEIRSGRMGIAYGSATGSPAALSHFIPLWFDKLMQGISAASYLQMMPHTCAANISVLFGITGRTIPTCSACTSGSQAIGYAYEAIKHGRQTMMIAGGAEELCVTIVAVFDSMYATSLHHAAPAAASRPFDAERDGLIIAEGGATLILEELEHAKARGAPILAEVIGFGTNSDGLHITDPSAERMQQCMQLALADAKLPPSAIGFISAHATATESGDIAEAAATHAAFGERTPVTALKSYFGHSLGASSAIEPWLAVAMMNEEWVAPVRNFARLDPRCAPLGIITGSGAALACEHVLVNNFAFGGTNTSLIFRRCG